jgi:hypothetical protein
MLTNLHLLDRQRRHPPLERLGEVWRSYAFPSCWPAGWPPSVVPWSHRGSGSKGPLLARPHEHLCGRDHRPCTSHSLTLAHGRMRRVLVRRAGDDGDTGEPAARPIRWQRVAVAAAVVFAIAVSAIRGTRPRGWPR